jgi:hypothetical protein
MCLDVFEMCLKIAKHYDRHVVYRNPRLFGNRDRRDDQQSDCAVHTQKNSFISNLVLQRVTFVGGGKLNWNFGGALCLRRHKGNHKYVTGDLHLCQCK